MPRQSNGSSSVYHNSEGWHGRVTVGVRDNGSPDRRHVRGKTKTDVTRKVRALEQARDTGKLIRVGQNWTLEQWLHHWVENIAGPFVRPNTLAGYRVAVNHHLIPGLGRHRLTALRPEHLERLYITMLATPTKAGTLTKAGTVHQVHRTLRTALNQAVKRGYLPSNPATVAKAPTITEDEIEPYTVQEIQRLLTTATGQRNGTRWAIALALGLRQGEVLGLKWSDVNFNTHTLTVRRNRLRPRYAHGCPTSQPCRRRYAGHCPHRTNTRPATDDTKSRAGRRLIGLPEALHQLLQHHRDNQNTEQAAAGQLWAGQDWLFATETGQPLNPRTDWDQWKKLLATAGIHDGRLHDARHTAATVLLLLGVTDRAIMAIMGWSNPAMTARYTHTVDTIRTDIAQRVDNLIWPPEQAPDRHPQHTRPKQTEPN